jgi:hypothetical protein
MLKGLRLSDSLVNATFPPSLPTHWSYSPAMLVYSTFAILLSLAATGHARRGKANFASMQSCVATWPADIASQECPLSPVASCGKDLQNSCCAEANGLLTLTQVSAIRTAFLLIFAHCSRSNGAGKRWLGVRRTGVSMACGPTAAKVVTPLIVTQAANWRLNNSRRWARQLRHVYFADDNRCARSDIERTCT